MELGDIQETSWEITPEIKSKLFQMITMNTIIRNEWGFLNTCLNPSSFAADRSWAVPLGRRHTKKHRVDWVYRTLITNICSLKLNGPVQEGTYAILCQNGESPSLHSCNTENACWLTYNNVLNEGCVLVSEGFKIVKGLIKQMKWNLTYRLSNFHLGLHMILPMTVIWLRIWKTFYSCKNKATIGESLRTHRTLSPKLHNVNIGN